MRSRLAQVRQACRFRRNAVKERRKTELLRRVLRGVGEVDFDDLVEAVAQRRLDSHTAVGQLIDAVAG